VDRARPPVRDRSDPRTWATARHEAGHSVAAITLGIRFRTVTLRPLNPDHAGAVLDVRLPPRRPLAFATICLAGVAATPPRGAILTEADAAALFEHEGAGDLRLINKHADGLSRTALVRLFLAAANIVRGTHADAVDDVAHRLVHHPEQTLTEAQVRVIVDDHQPGGISHLIRQMEAELGHGQPFGATSTNSDPSNVSAPLTVKR